MKIYAFVAFLLFNPLVVEAKMGESLVLIKIGSEGEPQFNVCVPEDVTYDLYPTRPWLVLYFVIDDLGHIHFSPYLSEKATRSSSRVIIGTYDSSASWRDAIKNFDIHWVRKDIGGFALFFLSGKQDVRAYSGISHSSPLHLGVRFTEPAIHGPGERMKQLSELITYVNSHLKTTECK